MKGADSKIIFIIGNHQLNWGCLNFLLMKKLLILFTALTLSAGLFAQEKMGDKMKMDKMDMKMDMKTDHYMMESGKMTLTKNGETMPMDKNITLQNGTTVNIDGTVKMKNGKTVKLKEGEMIYVTGKMSNMKMDKSMPH